MDISKAWGYGAVIVPKTGLWQGFIIPDPDDPTWALSVESALEVSGIATENILSISKLPVKPIGALAGTVASCLLEQDWPRVGVFASALSKMSGERFWVIEADEDVQGDGFTTRHIPLNATTPDEARNLIRSLGAVLEAEKLIRRGAS